MQERKHHPEELMLLGVVSKMSEEDRNSVEEAKRNILNLVRSYGDIGIIALTLVSFEFIEE